MPEDVFGIVGTVQAGTFKVREVVAEGGFAVVYRARHRAFRSNVALKCLKIPATLDSEEQKGFLRSFQEEAELLFRLSAAIPAVVRPLQAGKLQVQGPGFAPFLALEWLKGRTLSEFLEERRKKGEPPPRVSQAMKLLGPVFEALDRAHQFPGPSGLVCVVHRDLKPDNIFVADVGGTRTVKILDFGIAKAKSVANQLVGQQSMRASDFSAFTPAYAAPEQWNPKKYGQTGSWTDVWGLAMVMLECVVGSPIDDGEPAEFMARALDPYSRPTPRSLGVDVKDDVDQVFAKALAVDPRDRYQRISDFYRGLADAIGKSARKLPKLSFVEGNPDVTLSDMTGLSDGVDQLRSGSTAVSPVMSPGSSTVRDGVRDLEDAGDVPSLRLDDVRGPRADAVADDVVVEQAPPPPAPAAVPEYGSSSFDHVGRSIDGMTTFTRGDPIELAGGPVPAPAPRRRPPPVVHREAATQATFNTARKQLGLNGPIALAGIGCGLMLLDWVYAQLIGEAFRLGPLRTLWIAGPLAIIGLTQLISRVARADG